MRGEIVHPYWLTLLKSLIIYKSKGIYVPNTTLSKHEKQAIEEHTSARLRASSLDKIFQRSNKSRHTFDDATLDNLVIYLQPEFDYKNWRDFVSKEDCELIQELPRKNYYDLKEKQKARITRKIQQKLTNYEQNGTPKNLGNIQDFLQAGVIQELQSNFVKAKAMYLRCVEEAPQNPDYFIRLGTIEHKLGNVQEGVFWFEKAILLAESQNDIIYLCIAKNNLGLCLLDLQDYQKAQQTLTEALQMATQTLFHFQEQDLTYLHSNLGIAEMKLGNYSKAIFHLEKALLADMYANNDELLASRCTNLGLAYQFINSQKAEIYLSKAYFLDKTKCTTSAKWAISTYNLASYYIEQNQNQKAIPILEIYLTNIDLSPLEISSIELKNISLLAELTYQEEQWQQAQSCFKLLKGLLSSISPEKEHIRIKIIQSYLDFIHQKLTI